MPFDGAMHERQSWRRLQRRRAVLAHLRRSSLVRYSVECANKGWRSRIAKLTRVSGQTAMGGVNVHSLVSSAGTVIAQPQPGRRGAARLHG